MPIGGGESSGSVIVEVVNYSALPVANTVTGQLYAVLNSQGTYWLPGSLGGTYYGKGLYYSNGFSWIYTETPYNASQATVDAGTNDEQFVTPKTFTNASKWGTKESIITATTSTDYYRGDKTFQPLNKVAVGLGNVDNTSDINKPVSTAQSNALALKQDISSALTKGKVIQLINRNFI